MKDIKEKNIKWWIKLCSCFMLFLIIGVFAYFKMSFLMNGVKIEANISRLEENDNLVVVEGFAKNATKITLNNREIYINKNGYFRELISPLDGFSVVSISAEDKFGHKKEKEFQLIEKEDAKSVASIENN